jgi:membrane-associated phospholipid phosphatase
VRVDAAERERRLGIPEHPTNGDEGRYPTYIGNFSKTLPHNEFGEVDPAAYKALREALARGDFKAIEAVPKGGRVGYQDPTGGLTFSLYGPDAAAIAAVPPPPIASREYATQLAEMYWMALLRDVPFTDYATSPLVRQACEDLSRLSGNPGPRDPKTGQITPQSLFRAGYPGVTDGPIVSQFLMRRFRYDGIPIDPKISTSLPGADYLTAVPEWLEAQNGFPKMAPAQEVRDPAVRYLRNSRDLASLAGQDQIYSLYFRALLVLGGIPGMRPAASNPYLQCNRQVAFTTFGVAHLAELLGGAQVAHQAFYLKWNVHRFLRPEAGAGLTHFRKTGQRDYPIHDDLLKSPVLDLVFEANRKRNRERSQLDEGSYLLSQAASFGSPTHPSFVSVHATIAGACVTLLKAWYDESLPFPDPVQPNADGTELIPYVAGKDGPALTVGGELNKLCSNITFGRNILGVHYRADSEEGNRVGEECMLRALAERKSTFPMPFTAFILTRFNGQTVSI